MCKPINQLIITHPLTKEWTAWCQILKWNDVHDSKKHQTHKNQTVNRTQPFFAYFVSFVCFRSSQQQKIFKRVPYTFQISVTVTSALPYLKAGIRTLVLLRLAFGKHYTGSKAGPRKNDPGCALSGDLHGIIVYCGHMSACGHNSLDIFVTHTTSYVTLAITPSGTRPRGYSTV